MDTSVVLLLAEGFEEIEAVTTTDLLRRAGMEVLLISISRSKRVTGAHSVAVEADMILEDYNDIPDALVLPGGMPGSENLAKSPLVNQLIKNCADQKKLIAAICAAPAFVLMPLGVLAGKRATCFPGFERSFGTQARFEDAPVVVDGNIITANGPGAAGRFAVEIIAFLMGPDKAAIVRSRALIH